MTDWKGNVGMQLLLVTEENEDWKKYLNILSSDGMLAVKVGVPLGGCISSELQQYSSKILREGLKKIVEFFTKEGGSLKNKFVLKCILDHFQSFEHFLF